MVSLDAKIAPIKTLEWDEPAAVHKVELREQGKGNTVAYIHATDQAQGDYSKLVALREEFTRKGWATSSDNHHGKGVLRVTGISDERELTDLLNSSGATKGSARVSQADVAGQDSKGAVDFVKSNSLRASGILYLLGDVLFMTYGAKGPGKKLDWGQVGMGTSFAVGDIAILGFGGRDDKRQFKSLLTKLDSHLKQQGVEIPEGAALTAETLAKPGGVLEKTYDFVHEHVNTIKLLAEIAGGASLFKSGMKNAEGKVDNFKKASGAVIVTGWLAALLTQEKKPDKEHLKDAGALEKAQAYVQEKPLRLAAASGLVHNAIYTVGALKRRSNEIREHGTKSYRYDLAALSSMLVANSMYAICSKSTGGNIKADALVNDVYGLAAQILNRQPEATREAAINSTVEFLGQRPEIKDSKKEIAERLREEIKMQSENPWFKSIRQEGKALPGGETKVANAVSDGQYAAGAVKDILANATKAAGSHVENLEQSRLTGESQHSLH